MYFYKLYQKCYDKERQNPSPRIEDDKKDERGAFRINVDHRYYKALKNRSLGLAIYNSGLPFYIGSFALLAMAGLTESSFCAKASITCAVTAAMMSIYSATEKGGVLGDTIKAFDKAMEHKGNRLYFLQCEREEGLASEHAEHQGPHQATEPLLGVSAERQSDFEQVK